MTSDKKDMIWFETVTYAHQIDDMCYFIIKDNANNLKECNTIRGCVENLLNIITDLLEEIPTEDEKKSEE